MSGFWFLVLLLAYGGFATYGGVLVLRWLRTPLPVHAARIREQVDHDAPEGTLAADFRALHLAWADLLDAVADAVKSSAPVRWLVRRAEHRREDDA